MVYCGVAYFAIGVGSAIFSNPVAARDLQALMRLVALSLGILVFSLHIRYEISHWSGSPRITALRSSAALAGGTFLLAVYAVLYALINGTRSPRAMLLALVIWPLVTGVLGFLVALTAAAAVHSWRARNGGR